VGVVRFFEDLSLSVLDGTSNIVTSAPIAAGSANYLDLTIVVTVLENAGGTLNLHYDVQISLDGSRWLDAGITGNTTAVGTVPDAGPVRGPWVRLIIVADLSGAGGHVGCVSFRAVGNLLRS